MPARPELPSQEPKPVSRTIYVATFASAGAIAIDLGVFMCKFKDIPVTPREFVIYLAAGVTGGGIAGFISHHLDQEQR